MTVSTTDHFTSSTSSSSELEDEIRSESQLSLDQQRRRLSDPLDVTTARQYPDDIMVSARHQKQHQHQQQQKNNQQQQHRTTASTATKKKRTLVVYSGPTSLDRTIGKNDVYLTNFEYFIRHGIECHGLLGGTDDSFRQRQKKKQQRQRQHQSYQQQEQNQQKQKTESNYIQYVIVLTKEVADKYTAQDGLITQKQLECNNSQETNHANANDPLRPAQTTTTADPTMNNDNSLITVLVREDRCYDMESLLVVLRTIDVPKLYEHMVYINCGLAGPKFGPASPIPNWESLHSWTEIYTSLLSDKVQMVGHTINTHFHNVYSPHIQSFLFAVNTPMIDIWLTTGSIYECGVSNQEFQDEILRMALVWRYEVGISRVLIERGYSIAAAFIHQYGKIGVPLVLDNNSTFGRHWDQDEIIHSDVFTEEGLRRLTESSFGEYDDYNKYAILPWDGYVFFKVSRLIPYDIQHKLGFENLGPLQLVPNDARRSSMKKWRRKAGISLWRELLDTYLGLSYTANSNNSLICHRGRHCEFEGVEATTEKSIGITTMVIFLLWYFAVLKFVEMRMNLHRLREVRQKWK